MTQTTNWWEGTVVPTGRYRLRRSSWGAIYLQHLVRQTSGGRGRWITTQTLGAGASDDE
jgi:hypothetical protein